MNNVDANESLRVQENLGLVVKLARSFKPRTKEELDDLVQIGTIGLLKAIRKHDPAKGKLTTIAWGYIRWEIMRYLNAQQVMGTSKEQVIDSIADIDVEQIWEYLPDNLSRLERDTLLLKIEGHNFEDIGKKLGYTRGWTNKVFKSALRKIQNANTQ